MALVPELRGKWIKRGLLFSPDRGSVWAKHAVMVPTPVLLGNRIRVFAGFRNEAGISRIAFFDVSASNPAEILKVSGKPVLDLGEPGAFDDNGVHLGDLVPLDDRGRNWRMYYVGYQKPLKAKFFAFTGVAESTDGANAFSRCASVPVMDRAPESIALRALHCLRRERGGFRFWYACGDGWQTIGGKPYPRYFTRTGFSTDGKTFPREGREILPRKRNEYRAGRFRLFRIPKRREEFAFVTVGNLKGDYLAHCICRPNRSSDWRRLGIWLPPSEKAGAWDGRSVCYPAPIVVEDRLIAFYNGNEMGGSGVGWAEWRPR